MAYSELIKNFNNIRSYMREFFVYGFKTRLQYKQKGERTYDNERRRIESYLGDLVSFDYKAGGKNLFISLDGRGMTHNPLYKAFKCKSFTDKDITLHFIVMDILADGNEYSLNELVEKTNNHYFTDIDSSFSYENDCTDFRYYEFDESTLRKKMKEYESLGLIQTKKDGRVRKYQIANDNIDLSGVQDAIRFFTEENPMGVIGSYLEDKYQPAKDFLTFKNRYIMNAYDAEIIEVALQGIHEKKELIIPSKNEEEIRYIPLKLYVSTRGGRNYLLCKEVENGKITSRRIDKIEKATLGNAIDDFEREQAEFEVFSHNMWGTSLPDDLHTEHVEMDIHIEKDESFIIKRLEREKRCGMIIKVDKDTYRFSADVYDTNEMLPWFRTFLGRIKSFRCDNENVTMQLKKDFEFFADVYGVQK